MWSYHEYPKCSSLFTYIHLRICPKCNIQDCGNRELWVYCTSIILIVHCHAIYHVLIIKFGHIFILKLHPWNFITDIKHEIAGWGQRLNSLHRIYLLHYNRSFVSMRDASRYGCWLSGQRVLTMWLVESKSFSAWPSH
jgi:hypothetical protein